MNKIEEKLLDYFEAELEDLLLKLKPKAKKLAVFLINRDTKSEATGTTNKIVSPPMITFYLRNLIKARKAIIKQLRQLISHELVHAIQPKATSEIQHQTQERQADGRIETMNFFEDE